jgi:hypothetical protein
MNLQKRQHSYDWLFSFLLLMMFAGSALILILLGSHIYQNGVTHLDENYTVRTAVAYVSEKVRQNDVSGDISLQELEGIPALQLTENIDDNTYFTYIYFWNGALRELFLGADTTPSLTMGSTVVELTDFTITIPEEGFFRVTAVSDSGRSLSVLLHPSSV